MLLCSLVEAIKEHPQAPQEAEERFRISPEYQRYVAEPLSRRPIHDSSRESPTQKATRTKRGSRWTQFLLLSLRCSELLKNDIGNLLILLLQAPIIGTLLVVLMRFQIGPNIFNANVMLRCNPQVTTPSGPIGLSNVQPTTSVDCSQVLTFLQSNAQGIAYAHQQGGALAALQNFIQLSSGLNAQKMLFIAIFAAVLFGCVNGTREIVKELPIYRRERAVNLGLLPYMFSKIAVLGLLCLLQSAILVGLIEIAEPLRQGIFLPVVLEAYITLALTALAGLMLGLTISAVAPNTDRAVSFVPLVLLPQVLFAGALVPLTDWWTQIIAVIFPTRWALVALSSSVGLHDDKIEGNQLFGNDYASHGLLYSIYTKSEAIQRLLLSWGALVLLIIVFLAIIAFFLKRKDTRA
jgi:ABC transport system ATP-binding/permease protein